MTMRGLRKELELLKSSCQDSRYWNSPPKERSYLVEYEEKERHYDNLVLQSLKEHDGICGYKVGNKVCFQKHCDHKEERSEKDYQKEEQSNPLDLLIKALKIMISEEDKKKKNEDIEMQKLVPYSDTEDEEMFDTGVTVSEDEEEIIKGQAPMYLMPKGYKF